jgi:hypothetical protein
MSCCTPTIVPFTNEATKEIPYSAAMIEEYGSTPNIQVYYREGTEYVLSDDANRVDFNGVRILVDFGGPNTGIIKIS